MTDTPGLSQDQDLWHSIVQRERRTKRAVFFLTIFTSVVIAAGSALFGVYAYRQRDVSIAQRNLAISAAAEADGQRKLALDAQKEAELARDKANSLLLQVQRSSFVVATSPGRERSISSSGWLLDKSGAPMIFLGDFVSAAQFSPDGALARISHSGAGCRRETDAVHVERVCTACRHG